MNEEKETIMDDAIARYMQKDIMLEKCAWAIAHLSSKEQTNAVQQAISELAQIRNNILFAKDDGIDYMDCLAGMKRIEPG